MDAKKSKEKFQNYVQKDGVIKEVITLDRKLQDTRLWNYYDINKVCLDIALSKGYTEEEFKRIFRSDKHKGDLKSNDEWKLTTRRGYPRTTAGEIGWRHEPRNHNLELYGKLYKSPKFTMEPLYIAAEVIFLG